MRFLCCSPCMVKQWSWLHADRCPPHADRLLWPRIFAVKRQQPPPVPFFLPFLPSAFISHFSAGACGAAFLPGQFTCLPSKQTLLTHALLSASLTLTARVCFPAGSNSLTAGISLALCCIYKQYHVGLVMAECYLLIVISLII